jgi:hypothetical protein
MPGFVRSQAGASRYGLALEATMLVLDDGDQGRVVLCGVDTIGIPAPEVDELRARVADAAGADPDAVLLNWNHTHRSPPACPTFLRCSGLLAADLEDDPRFEAYWRLLSDRLVGAARQAAAGLEPAAVVWGTGEVDVSVNRRERAPDGEIVHGWRLDGLLDRQVVSLQARRRDDTVIGTLVCFGCHTVSVGMDFPGYSADYPGALRTELRRFTGGECVFFQGAGGNVLPQVAFLETEHEAHRIGSLLAVEALHCLAGRPAWPRRLVRRFDGSLIPMLLVRFEDLAEADVVVSAAAEVLRFPMLELPTASELEALAADYEGRADEATRRGAGNAELFGLLYHAKWARRRLALMATTDVEPWLAGPVHAVRVGDGMIATGPGEVFTEIGMAVKQRAPGRPTAYAGYTNGALGYFPTAAAYDEGGYEPTISNRSYGQAAPMAPACERMLVETAVRLGERLFPERPPYAGDGWEAGDSVPALPREWLERPRAEAYEPPRTAKYRGGGQSDG